jgi:hypothetical protein
MYFNESSPDESVTNSSALKDVLGDGCLLCVKCRRHGAAPKDGIAGTRRHDMSMSQFDSRLGYFWNTVVEIPIEMFRNDLAGSGGVEDGNGWQPGLGRDHGPTHRNLAAAQAAPIRIHAA